jgi:hypothetical protein
MIRGISKRRELTCERREKDCDQAKEQVGRAHLNFFTRIRASKFWIVTWDLGTQMME